MINYERLFLLLDNLYEGAYLINSDNEITYWNKSAEQITGYLKSDIVDKIKFYEIFTYISRDGVNLCNSQSFSLFSTLFNNGKIQDNQKNYVRNKAGHQIPVSIRVITFCNKRRSVIENIHLFNDNSPRDFLEKEYRELKDLAVIDQLTKLKNRRYAENIVGEKLSNLKISGLPLGILFIDIDEFKIINDSYGHKVGDLILQMVGQTLLRNVRPSDIVVRWGGDEMIIILNGNLNNSKLSHIANELRVLVENSSADHYKKITISIGATLAQEDDTLESLIKRADELMYSSKKTGRNCVTVG